jgi:hypothetical protein
MRGTCLCGGVAYEVEGPFQFLTSCHCSMCRKHHGTAFVSWLGAEAKAFRFVKGEERVAHYDSSPGLARTFCRDCGAKVPHLPGPGSVVIPAGTLDGDPGLRPMAHIFAASKAPWHEITDTLPRFDEYPPGLETPRVPERPRPRAAPGKVVGSCLCGGVAFEVDGPIDFIRNCHCSRCRKARGTAHASNAFVALDRFRWTRGAELVAEYKLPEARFFTHAFCRTCGSSTPRRATDRGFAVIPAGSFDGDPGAREREHIFVASKAPWWEITDALPQHAEGAPA